MSASIGKKAKYRIPDQITGGTWESLEKELKTVGYYSEGLAKIEAAQNISKYMEPQRNVSVSFQLFYHTLLELNTCN